MKCLIICFAHVAGMKLGRSELLEGCKKADGLARINTKNKAPKVNLQEGTLGAK
jgi:hypothetical protein